jgi:uncharacterized membrane protein YeaQ/YmgE (transglycosylase-associated protein family)
MSLIELVVLVIVAAIAGILGQSLAGYRRGGWLVAAVVGFIGALIGIWLANQLHLPELINLRIGGTSFPLIWAIIGAAILAFVVSFIAHPRRRYYRRRRRYL